MTEATTNSVLYPARAAPVAGYVGDVINVTWEPYINVVLQEVHFV